jgi:hypothetical protein
MEIYLGDVCLYIVRGNQWYATIQNPIGIYGLPLFEMRCGLVYATKHNVQYVTEKPLYYRVNNEFNPTGFSAELLPLNMNLHKRDPP